MVSLFGRGFDSHQLHPINQTKAVASFAAAFLFSFLFAICNLCLKTLVTHCIPGGYGVADRVADDGASATATCKLLLAY